MRVLITRDAREGYVSFWEITMTDDSLPESDKFSLPTYDFAVAMLFDHDTRTGYLNSFSDCTG